MQIYLATSFVFTMFQSAALRNDNIRDFFGLSSLDVQRQQKIGAVTKEFVDIKEFEKEAKEARGEGDLLGEHGVLQPGWESTIPGTSRPSTIVGSTGGSGSGSAESCNILVEAEAEAPKTMLLPLPLCFKAAVQIFAN